MIEGRDSTRCGNEIAISFFWAIIPAHGSADQMSRLDGERIHQAAVSSAMSLKR